MTAITAAVVSIALAGPALAGGGGESQNQFAKASSSPGQINLRAGYWKRIYPAAHGSGDSSGHQPSPPCTYYPAGPLASSLLGPGGAEPGAWYLPNCKFAKLFGNPMPAVWVVGAPATPLASPIVLSKQAVAKLPLVGPHIGMSPPSNRPQIVRVATWLWITGAWRGRSATATAGTASATATAAPYKIVWHMGDGHTVTCLGPGTPYKPNEPASAQTTNCSYTYSTPSSTAPGGRFTVSATVFYRVTWVARGAPGGGNLGLVASPTARTTVLVEQAEALNSAGG